MYITHSLELQSTICPLSIARKSQMATRRTTANVLNKENGNVLCGAFVCVNVGKRLGIACFRVCVCVCCADILLESNLKLFTSSRFPHGSLFSLPFRETRHPPMSYRRRRRRPRIRRQLFADRLRCEDIASIVAAATGAITAAGVHQLCRSRGGTPCVPSSIVRPDFRHIQIERIQDDVVFAILIVAGRRNFHIRSDGVVAQRITIEWNAMQISHDSYNANATHNSEWPYLSLRPLASLTDADAVMMTFGSVGMYWSCGVSRTRWSKWRA